VACANSLQKNRKKVCKKNGAMTLRALDGTNPEPKSGSVFAENRISDELQVLVETLFF